MLLWQTGMCRRGVGVGLPLCREILSEHGGKLSVHNREGGGLAATCWLPPG